MDIDGVATVVTGGASGLGAAVVERLSALGARVAVLDVDAERGRATAEAARGAFVRVDVTDDAGVEAGLAEAEGLHGRARILVNCAGIGPPQRVVNREGAPHDLALFRKVIAINLVGTFTMLSRFAARLAPAELLGEERGVIVNTASVAAYDGQIGQAAYASSKAGVVGMTLPVARDLASLAIRVVTIAPGLFLTPLLAGLPQAAQDSLGKQPPFPNRLGAPKEFAMLVESVIANPMLNGETIRLDGALRMAPR